MNTKTELTTDDSPMDVKEYDKFLWRTEGIREKFMKEFVEEVILKIID